MQSLNVSYSAFRNTCTRSENTIKEIKALQQVLQLCWFFWSPSFTFLPVVSSFSEQHRAWAWLVRRKLLWRHCNQLKARCATLWRSAANKTKRYVCNLARCLLTGPCSSILATAGGKRGREEKNWRLCTRVTSSSPGANPALSRTPYFLIHEVLLMSAVPTLLCGHAHTLRINPLGLDRCSCPSLSTPLLPQRA